MRLLYLLIFSLILSASFPSYGPIRGGIKQSPFSWAWHNAGFHVKFPGNGNRLVTWQSSHHPRAIAVWRSVGHCLSIFATLPSVSSKLSANWDHRGNFYVTILLDTSSNIWISSFLTMINLLSPITNFFDITIHCFLIKWTNCSGVLRLKWPVYCASFEKFRSEANPFC